MNELLKSRFCVTGIVLLLVAGMPLTFAQIPDEWKTEKSKDGKIQIVSRVYSMQEGDEEFQIMEYKASTQAMVKYENCVAVLKDIDQHKLFLADTKVSEKIETGSPNKLVVYYFIDTPWPVPDSDCVTFFTIVENQAKREFTLMGVAKPDEYADKGVQRMRISDIRYSITERKKNGTVLIEISGRFSPAVYAPSWALRRWTPEGPVKMMNAFIDLAASLATPK